MSNRRNSHFIKLVVGLSGALFLALITVPYLYAVRQTAGGYVFSGFLFNPIDGNTYLAKMHQGFEGGWQYTLPYTAEQTSGAPLFLYYLTLGHIARGFSLDLRLVFHAARIFGAVLLLTSLWRLVKQVDPVLSDTAKYAWVLAVLGSGIGWMLVGAGILLPDLWVAEAFPFLSAYSSPHFTLGLALLILLLTPVTIKSRFQNSINFLLGLFTGSLLALIAQFGTVVAGTVLLFTAFWNSDNSSRKLSRFMGQEFWRALGTVLGGLPLLVWQMVIIRSDPVLAGWNAQNITPSPPPWETLLAVSPALPLAIWGLIHFDWQQIKTTQKVLVVWFLLGLGLAYIPWSLQRRFLFGWYIPIAILGGFGLTHLLKQLTSRWRPVLLALVLILALPSNLLVLISGAGAVAQQNPAVFLTRDEADALIWIDQYISPDALFLTGPELGLFVPAWAGGRVLYGHPFETVQAKTREAEVTEFFSWSLDKQESYLDFWEVGYIVYGEREQKYGALPVLPAWEQVYEQGSVQILSRIIDSDQ